MKIILLLTLCLVSKHLFSQEKSSALDIAKILAERKKMPTTKPYNMPNSLANNSFPVTKIDSSKYGLDLYKSQLDGMIIVKPNSNFSSKMPNGIIILQDKNIPTLPITDSLGKK